MGRAHSHVKRGPVSRQPRTDALDIRRARLHDLEEVERHKWRRVRRDSSLETAMASAIAEDASRKEGQ
jgi:hypothetical protein